MPPWEVRRLRAAVADLHGRRVDFTRRSVTVCEAVDVAVVLGSTQPGDGVRRRTGGGAVLVAPGDPLWVDVVVPRDDPLWVDDVGRAFWWLGEVWASLVGGAVHRGPLVRTRWSDSVCFAGLGPGEVTVDGRKVIGMAQRRTRAGALFQCAAPRTWDPGPLVSRLGLPPSAAEDLAEAVAPLGDALDVVERSFVESLPS